jgi:Na+-driven multidrug efflux pump
LLGGRWFYGLFFSEPEIVEYGVQIMRVMTLVVLMQVAQCVYTGSLRGAGDMVHVMIVGTISISFIRPSVSYLAAYVCDLGIMGIWCGVLADQFTRLVCNRARYKSGKWMKIKI